MYKNTKINQSALSWIVNPKRVALGVTLGSLAIFGLAAVVPQICDPVSAEEATQDVPVSVNVGSMISITAPDNLTMNVTPKTTDPDLSKASGTVSVATNNQAGYKLLLAMSDSSMSNDLVHTLNSDFTIPTLEGDQDTPTAIADFSANHWGYSTEDPTALTQFYPLPSVGSSKQLKSTSAPSTVDITNFTIGTKVNTSKVAGTYSNIVKFTAVTNTLTP